MNKISLYFISIFISVILFSCQKDDDTKIAPPRDLAEQYAADIDSIEEYLKTHYLTQVMVDDRIDVQISPIPVGGSQVSIWDNTEFPLQHKIIKNDSRLNLLVEGRVEDPVDYKMYYLILNEGGGQQASKFDSTYVSYRGWKLDNEQFDINNTPFWSTFPAMTTAENELISGFRQFTALLKTAESVTTNDDGSIVYNNYGAGVVFIPSGLGYFNATRTNLPAYSPLVFTIRMHAARERDHDGDKLLSKYENLDGDEDYFNDDTDADNIPDFLDRDDDGDAVRTKDEIRKPAGAIVTGLSKFYPFNPIMDDPSTVGVDETETYGIPRCGAVETDPDGYTNPVRLRKHLDPNCQ